MTPPFERLLAAFLGVLIGGLPCTDALAWSMGGHRVTGVMAAREISATAPRVAATITAIMQAHPAAEAFNARADEAGHEPRKRLERLFAEMAQWPDEVRGGPLRDFHRGSWHTIGIPFVTPGFKPAPEPREPAENLEWALQENTRIAADPAAPAHDRAVALCWIFHLVGDLHQPLHAASLFSPEFPDGDFFATRFRVMPPPGNDTVSLHYFWDSAVQRSQNATLVERTATHLRSTHPPESLDDMRDRPYRGPASFGRWIREESHALAISEAYRAGSLARGTANSGATRLSDEYVANARAIAARRMAMAAYRLAEVLRFLFP